MDDTKAIDGLRYIADSPAHGHGGFHPETVSTANDALDEIAALKARIAELEAELGVRERRDRKEAN